MSLDTRLQRAWYSHEADWLSASLVPLSHLFGVLAKLRRRAYETRRLPSFAVEIPVIVVGNVTVGGTGKTPFVTWLANHIVGRGHRVAIVTRGYGGASKRWPKEVTADSDPNEVGDEAVLMAQKTAALVIADPNRVRAAQHAVTRAADVIVCDDGLQHYRLRRDAEFAVIDGSRGFGNGRMLPAGPLREPVTRLARVDLVLINQRMGARAEELRIDTQGKPQTLFGLILLGVRSLATGEQRTIESFRGLKIHAVAGIGNPPGFFQALRAAGLCAVEHAYPDHARYAPRELEFGDSADVFMTEKDGVKYRPFATARHWVVETKVSLSPPDEAKTLALVDSILQRHQRLAYPA